MLTATNVRIGLIEGSAGIPSAVGGQQDDTVAFALTKACVRQLPSITQGVAIQPDRSAGGEALGVSPSARIAPEERSMNIIDEVPAPLMYRKWLVDLLQRTTVLSSRPVRYRPKAPVRMRCL